MRIVLVVSLVWSVCWFNLMYFFFFKQKTAYEMRISDWSSDVCSSDLRQSKSKARLQRFEEMQSQEFQKRAETNEIYIPAGPRLGDKVIEFKNVTKGYGDRVLIDNLSFAMPKGAIVGVIGGNGAGKIGRAHV